jgi:hypothetical protein
MLNGYDIFHPLAPNLFLSSSVLWKKHKANKMDLILMSLSSISSFEKNVQALFMLALSPDGGSFVNLIDLSRIPKDGSAERNNLN